MFLKIRKSVAEFLLFFSEILPKISWRIRLLSAYVEGSRESRDFLVRIKREKEWYREKGDETFLLDFDLSKSSVIFDIGGYIGNFAANIFARYGSEVHIFEPVPEYLNRLKKRFGINQNIVLHDYAVGGTDSELTIYVSEGASSFYPDKINYSEVKSVAVKTFGNILSQLNFNEVDLVSMNIEGAEYDLINNLIDSGDIKKIKFLQVQFHEIDDMSTNSRDAIRKKLSFTHKEKYCYPFVWEAWERL